jgi:hypothetical protein
LETADKQIIFSNHAKIKMADRGVTESDVIRAIKEGSAEPARKDRILIRKNIPFDNTWRGKHYSVKQIAPVVAEDNDKIVVITVYVYYF